MQGEKYRLVVTIQIKETILQKVIERKDAQGRRINSRLESCHNLVAGAVYHSGCMSQFLKKINFGNDVERPISMEKTSAFEKMCDWLEKDRIQN